MIENYFATRGTRFDILSLRALQKHEQNLLRKPGEMIVDRVIVPERALSGARRRHLSKY
jgi:hypothetical protein